MKNGQIGCHLYSNYVRPLPQRERVSFSERDFVRRQKYPGGPGGAAGTLGAWLSERSGDID